MPNWYWREKNFEGLRTVAIEAAKNPDTVLYSEYCELREKGLRKEAFQKLTQFINRACTWDLDKRFYFVDWLENIRYNNEEIYDLIPHPLYQMLVQPTLLEWIETNPDDPAGYRWLGDIDSLRKAVSISSHEQIAREKLIDDLIHKVGYSVHHLPEGYIGDPSEDLTILNEIKTLITSIEDIVLIEKFDGQYADLHELVKSYFDYTQSSGVQSFEMWAISNNRKYQ